MNFDNWKWLNESKIAVDEDEVTIYAPGHQDWFRNPVPNAEGAFDKPVAEAPVLYMEIEGDFVFSAKVTPHHKNSYDACALMVIENETLWAKLAFEASDFGSNAVVCVVTNEFSDDCNGCDITQESIWLKFIRVGDVFSAHYSLDGEEYHMVRLFRLPMFKTIKVGLEAQCPLGEGGERTFSEIKIERKTICNLRTGE